MPAVVFLLMLVAAMGMVDSRSSDRFQADREAASAVAEQLAYYHSQALAKCTVVSPPATSQHGTPACGANITVDTSGVNPNARFNYAGKFRSASDGDWIVTVFRNDAGTRNDDAKHQWGLISAGLRDITRNSIAAGPYQASTGRINNGQIFQSTVGGVTTTGTAHTQVPPAFVGWLGLVDGIPIIATRAR